LPVIATVIITQPPIYADYHGYFIIILYVTVHGTLKLEIWASCFCTVFPNF